MTSITCRTCTRTFGIDAFTKDGLRRKLCRDCTKIRLHRVRRSTPARRLYFNLLQNMRKRGCVESAYWSLEDVERLLDSCTTKEGIVRIVRVDNTRPWLVDNSKVVGERR